MSRTGRPLGAGVAAISPGDQHRGELSFRGPAFAPYGGRMNKSIVIAVAAVSLSVGAVGCGSSQQSRGHTSAGAAVGTHSSASGSASASAASSSSAAAGKTTSGINYRTVDPCSLISQHALDSFAPQATRSVTYSDYDSCAMDLRKGNRGWTLQVDMSNSFTSPAQQIGQVYHVTLKGVTDHGTTVYAGNGGRSGCVRAFNLPGNGPTFVVDALSLSNHQCVAAEAAIASAITASSSGAVKQLPVPADSLARLDFCASFANAAATALGGAVTSHPSGTHGCEWSHGPSRTLIASLQATTWPPQALSHAKVQQVARHPVAEVTVRGAGEELVQAAVKFGAPPALVAAPGESDSISVLSAARGSDAAQLPQKLRQFLITVAAVQAS
jgi:hypothetical protein